MIWPRLSRQQAAQAVQAVPAVPDDQRSRRCPRPNPMSEAAALRARFLDWFGRWESPIGQDISDLSVLGSGDVAVAHMLIRASGTLNGGREVGYWVRTTNGCRRSGGRWSITHEHVSLPVDMATGRAVMDLAP